MNITQETISKIHTLLDAGLVSGIGHPVPGQMCVEAVVCYALGLPHSDDPQCVLPVLRSLKIRLNDQDWSSNKARAEGLRRLAIAQLGTEKLDWVDFCNRLTRMTIQKVIPATFREIAPILTGEHSEKLLALAVKCEAEPTEAHAKEAQTAAYDAYAAKGAYADVSNAYAAAHAANAACKAAYAAKAATYAANVANAAYVYAYVTAVADAAADAVAYAARAVAKAAQAVARATYAAKAATYAAKAATYAANVAADAAQDRVLAEYAENVVQILIEMNAPGVKWL